MAVIVRVAKALPQNDIQLLLIMGPGIGRAQGERLMVSSWTWVGGGGGGCEGVACGMGVV